MENRLWTELTGAVQKHADTNNLCNFCNLIKKCLAPVRFADGKLLIEYAGDKSKRLAKPYASLLNGCSTVDLSVFGEISQSPIVL